MRDLIGRHAMHLKQVDEKHAVLIHRLRAVGRDAPVRGELWRLDIQLVQSEHCVGVAYIESEQHRFLV